MDDSETQLFETLIEQATDNILSLLKSKKISKKKIHNAILNNIKKKTKKKKSIKAIRVPLYISDSSE